MSDEGTLKLQITTEVDESSLRQTVSTIAERVKQTPATVRVRAESSGPAQRIQQAERRPQEIGGYARTVERARQPYQKAFSSPADPAEEPATTAGPVQRLREAERLLADARQMKAQPGRAQDAVLNLMGKRPAAPSLQSVLSGGEKPAARVAEDFGRRFADTLKDRLPKMAGRVAEMVPGGSRIAGLIGEGGSVMKGLSGFASELGGVAAGVQTFGWALQVATDAARNFGNLQLTSGGTVKETATLDVLARVLSTKENPLTGTQLAGVARTLAQNKTIGSGNIGAQLTFGYQMPAYLGGPTDDLKGLYAAIQKIIHAPTTAAAERIARQSPGLEQFLQLRQMPPGMLKIMDMAAQFHGDTAAGGQTAAMLWQATTRLPLLFAEDVKTRAADKITGFDAVKKFEKATGITTDAGGKSAADAFRPGRGAIGSDPLVQGMKDLHGAIVANTQTLMQTIPLMRDANRHVFGGADRARALSPAHARYTNLQYFLGDQRLLLGQL